jgi:mRNA interferase RelE/StbE
MKYKVYYTTKANKHLGKLHPHHRGLVVNKTNKLASIHESSNKQVKRMKGISDLFRLRVGKVRVLFRIDHKKKEILVLDIGYRGQIY